MQAIWIPWYLLADIALLASRLKLGVRFMSMFCEMMESITHGGRSRRDVFVAEGVDVGDENQAPRPMARAETRRVVT
jgi:hypothetical protein